MLIYFCEPTYIFVKIVEAEICEILTEKEFKQRGIEKFVDYL